MQNPVKAAREERGLSRPKFAMLVNLDYQQVAAVENGQRRQLPESWRGPLENAGLSFDDLARDYTDWRRDQVVELQRSAVRHG